MNRNKIIKKINKDIKKINGNCHYPFVKNLYNLCETLQETPKRGLKIQKRFVKNLLKLSSCNFENKEIIKNLCNMGFWI